MVGKTASTLFELHTSCTDTRPGVEIEKNGYTNNFDTQSTRSFQRTVMLTYYSIPISFFRS